MLSRKSVQIHLRARTKTSVLTNTYTAHLGQSAGKVERGVGELPRVECHRVERRGVDAPHCLPRHLRCTQLHLRFARQLGAVVPTAVLLDALFLVGHPVLRPLRQGRSGE